MLQVNPRRIALTVQQRSRVFGDTVGIGFVLAVPGAVAADSIEIPGPPLVLQRDEAVAITVHNRLAIPTSVHWHGMELESYFDGVGGWSGSATHVAPVIAPRDSFVARFTPPRSGTFIYHSHFGEVRQLSLGLFGALVVLDPGEQWDAGVIAWCCLPSRGWAIRRWWWRITPSSRCDRASRIACASSTSHRPMPSKWRHCKEAPR
ncbi:MAG: multicopper oxidase domain-containing protein [Gemmatimonadetes bacterium]|nr:multicopper oxidase domain-containing protein [Gemmatimonadota bacterium]